MINSIIMAQVIWLIITGVLLLALSLITINIITQRNTPLISSLIKRRYLKVKFKLWDDLKRLDASANSARARASYSLHKLELNTLYFLALLFKSPEDSFTLINCDRRKEDCADEVFQQYRQKQKRLTLFSVYALFLLITANITTGLLVSFLFPNIFDTQASTTITHSTTADWALGTFSQATTTGDTIIFDTQSSAVSFTHTSQEDWEGGSVSGIDTLDSPGDLKLKYGPTRSFGDSGKMIFEETVVGSSLSARFTGIGNDNIAVAYKSNEFDGCRVQGIDIDGNTLWETEIATSTLGSYYCYVAKNSEGGAFVAWGDNRSGNTHIYVQSLDSSGNRLWEYNGIKICDNDLNKYLSATDSPIISDEEGGAIILWYNSSNYKPYAQRINSLGEPLWSESGVLLTTNEDWKSEFSLISDEAGGAFVAWSQRDYPDTLYAQKISFDGGLLWGDNGVLVAQMRFINGAVFDGSDGLVLSWIDGWQREGEDVADIYAQRLDSDGNVYPGWPANGAEVRQHSANYSTNIAITGDGTGGAFIADPYGYINRIDGTGSVVFNKLVVSFFPPCVRSDGLGGAYVAINGLAGSSYVNHLDENGNWDQGDIYIEIDDSRYSAIPQYQQHVNIFEGGIYALFLSTDIGSTDYNDLYIQRLDISNLTYLSEGVYTSPSIDANNTVNWSTLTPSETTPANTSITYETRTKAGGYPNLSLTASAVATSEYLIYTADKAIDGDYFTAENNSTWANSPADPTPEYTITLSATSSISYFSLYFSSLSGTDYYCSDYTIDAHNGADWENIITESGNSSLTKSHSFEAIDAQLIKFTCSSAPNGIVAISEFEIYESYVPNLSLSATASASSYFEPEPGAETLPEYAIDGIEATTENNSAWLNNMGDADIWLKIDLGEEKTVSHSNVYFVRNEDMALDLYCSDYTISYSLDDSDYTQILAETGNTSLSTSHSFDPVQAQYIRFNCSNAPTMGIAGISEFEIYETNPGDWTAWQPTSGTTIQSPAGRYLQYRATLSTTDTTVTPTLSSVTVSAPASYYDTATYTSPILDSGTAGATWSDITISSTTPAGTSITTYTRTGETDTVDETWSEWALVNSPISSPAGQYLQYQLVMESTDTTETPTISSVELSYTAGGDSTAPTISSVSSSNITTNSAVITWTTDESSDSKVSYGTASNSYTNFETSAVLTTSHSINLSGLAPNTTYYYVVTSADASANSATSSEATFTTQAESGSTPDPTPAPTTGAVILPITPPTQTPPPDEATSTDPETDTKEPTDQAPADTEETETDTDTDTDIEVEIVPEQEETEEETEDTNEVTEIETETETTETEETDTSADTETDSDTEDDDYYFTRDDIKDISPSRVRPLWQEALSALASLNNSVPAQAIREASERIKNFIISKTGAITDGPEFIAIKSAIIEASDTTPAKTTNVTLVTAYTLVSASQIVVLAGSANNLPYIFVNLFGALFYRRGWKKRRGTVYDMSTGEPVSFARVSILDKSGKVKDIRVTDKYGTYFFLVPKGEYTLKADKPGYELIGQEDKSKAKTLYHPPYTKNQSLKYSQEDIVNPALPLNRVKLSKFAELFSKTSAYTIASLLFYFGLVVSIVMALANPIITNYIVALIYLSLYLVRSANFAHPKWGTIKGKGGNLESFAQIEVFDANENKNPVARTVADEFARYALILDKGRYLIKAQTTEGKTIRDTLETKERKIIGKDLKV